MNNRVITSLITLGGVLLAAIPMLSRRVRPTGWQRILQMFSQPMNTMMGRGGRWRRMVRRVRA